LFSYQTLTGADYAAFLTAYVRSREWWAPQDFGKPNIDKLPAESRSWEPTLQQMWIEETRQQHRVLAQLAISDALSEERGLVAWPKSMYLELTLPKEEPMLQLTFCGLGKAANRMPEAMWLTFAPKVATSATWFLEKVNQKVSPLDVVGGGGRRMHAVTGSFSCQDGTDTLYIETLDAPVIAFEPQSPLNFSQDLPDLRKGVHVCLFNNAWGTNYPQWAGGDWMYRFELRG
jgi:hypothetical protein